MDPYAVLAVERETDLSEADLRRAYRTLSLQHHPDRPSGCRERFEQLGSALAACLEDLGRRGERRREDLTQETLVYLTVHEFLNGGSRMIYVPGVCSVCNGTGARDPEDFIVCLTCEGVGGECSSCGGHGGCNVTMRRCRSCQGTRVREPTSVRVIISAGMQDGTKVGQIRISHRDLAEPVRLADDHSVALLVCRETGMQRVNLTTHITLGQLLCGFRRTIDVFGEVVTLDHCSQDYDPQIPSRLFAHVQLAAFSVDVFITIVFPLRTSVAPFRRVLARILA